MAPYPSNFRQRDRSLIALALAGLALFTPITDLWAAAESLWLSPFLLWLLFIALALWVAFADGPAKAAASDLDDGLGDD